MNNEYEYVEKVATLIEQLDEDEELFNDRREYTVEDLCGAYELPEEEAVIVYNWIRSKCDPQYQCYHIAYNEPAKVGTMIMESLHQGLDGWTPYQKAVIEAFLADIAFAISCAERKV